MITFIKWLGLATITFEQFLVESVEPKEGDAKLVIHSHPDKAGRPMRRYFLYVVEDGKYTVHNSWRDTPEGRLQARNAYHSYVGQDDKVVKINAPKQ